MAKLTARGRREMLRLVREQQDPATESTDWSRHTVVVMDDGSVLQKLDVHFRSDDRRHSYGWKLLRGRVPGWDRAQADRLAEQFTSKGYTITLSPV